MSATVIPLLRTKRVLTLRCAHAQESEARAGSTLTCRTCGDHGKITASIVAAAEAKAKPASTATETPRRATLTAPYVSRGARLPAGRWAPASIARQQPDEQPGNCPDCGGPRAWRGRASLAWCPKCATAGLAPQTLRAHTRAAGLQQHRGTTERDDDAETLYQRVQALLDVLDPLLADQALNADERGSFRWLHEELVSARREKNAARVAELTERAASLGVESDTDVDVWEPDDSTDDGDDDDQAEVAGHGDVSPAAPLTFLATTMPAPVVTPYRPPVIAARRTRKTVVVHRRKKQPQPQNWMLPLPAAAAPIPLLERGDAARQQMERDGKQITAGLADAAARGQHVTPSLLAQGCGNSWRVPVPGGGPQLVEARFYQLPASGRATPRSGWRRGQAVTAPGRLAIASGAGSDWYTQYHEAQAAAWKTTGAS